MKALQTIQAVALSCLLSIGAASCGSEESNQPYTPLQVYFDPVRVDMNAEHLMPYFVNYPTDWAKMGLRNYPKLVTYEYHNAQWGVTSTSQYEFLPTAVYPNSGALLSMWVQPDLMSFRMNITAIPI